MRISHPEKKSISLLYFISNKSAKNLFDKEKDATAGAKTLGPFKDRTSFTALIKGIL